MFKKLIILFLIIAIPMLAQTLKLNKHDEKVLSDNGIKINEIAAIVYGNVEDNNVKSTIVAGKFILLHPSIHLNIYDPWDEANARENKQKKSKISIVPKAKYGIVIITANKIHVLLDFKEGSFHYKEFSDKDYVMKVKPIKRKGVFFSAWDKKPLYPNRVIAIQGGYGEDDILYWNNEKYVFVWVMPDETFD